MCRNLASGNVLQLLGNHLLPYRRHVVHEQVAVQMRHLVLHHAAGELVELLGHLSPFSS